jgi:NAD(P)-dependent dehydrogenase (short-subunit alcohol dehydrogenase family)
MRIEGSAAIVTGGASGLGEATARMLAGAGAKVTIFDRNEEQGEAAAQRIGCDCAAIDITDDVAVSEALDRAAARQGAARILVNCAGISSATKTVGRDGSAHALDVFRRVVDINLVGTFNCLSKAAARMIAVVALGEERGVIVNTASAAAFDGTVGMAAYAASKAAVAGMTLPIARDLGPHGIRVVSIAPGLFATPMFDGVPEAARDSMNRQAPFPQRPGNPEEYALLVRTIVENPMLNGTTIRLDGALRLAPK